MTKRRHVLRKWLRDTHTRQGELAARVGLSDTHMSNIINGKRVMSLEIALKLALVTGISVEKLLKRRSASILLETYGNRQSLPSEMVRETIKA